MKKNKELLLTIETLANEKNIKLENAAEAFCQAITTSTKRRIDKEANIQTSLDLKTGSYEITRTYKIVDDNFEGFDDSIHIYEDQAEDKVSSGHEDYEIDGDTLTERLSSEARRVDFQVVRQVLMQKINEMAKKEVNESDLVNKIYNLKIMSIEKRGYVVSFKGDMDGFLPRNELIGKEYFKVGASTPALLMQDEKYSNKTYVFTRRGERFLKELIAQEVEDVANGDVIVHSAYSTDEEHYIAVSSLDGYTDPVRSCLGHNGYRKNTIFKSAGYKKVNFLRWNPNPVDMALDLIGEDEVETAYVDEQLGVITLISESGTLDDMESVDIANGLIKDWTIKVLTQEEHDAATQYRDRYYINMFMDSINVDEYVSEILVSNGFTSLDELVHASREELMEIPEFNVEGADEVISEIKSAAQEKLEEIMDSVEGASLTQLKSIDKYSAHKLVNDGVKTINDVAELSIFEVNDTIEGYPYASDLIMEARKEVGLA